MALKLSKTSRSVTGDYWQIYKLSWDKTQNKTLARLRCYVNTAARDAGAGNYLDMPDFMETKFLNGCLDIDGAYVQMVVSEKVQDKNKDGTPKVDENGEAVMVETNKWVSAEAC